MSEESKKLAKAMVALKSVDMGIRTRAIDAVKADEVEIAVGLSLEDDPPEFEKWVISKGSGNTPLYLHAIVTVALFPTSIIPAPPLITLTSTMMACYSPLQFLLFKSHPPNKVHQYPHHSLSPYCSIQVLSLALLYSSTR